MSAESTELLTIKQFLERHRKLFSEASLRRYIEKGGIEIVQPGGPKSQIFIPADALDRLKTRRQPALQHVGQKRTGHNASLSKTSTPRWKRGHQ